MKSLILVLAFAYLAWWVWFYTKPGRAVVRWMFHLCPHKFIDTTVPFSDFTGGWHVCSHCQRRKYIRWGMQFTRLEKLGMIGVDEKRGDELMDQFTGFSSILKGLNHD